jgi:hypothetical protein
VPGQAVPVAPVAAKPKSKKPKISKIEQFENEIVGLESETAAIFKNGRKILQKGGAKYSVTFTAGEMQKMAGAVVTHNHPLASDSAKGLGFSPADISMGLVNGVNEIRAVSGDYVYSFKPNGIEWNPKIQKSILDIDKRIAAKWTKWLNARIAGDTTDSQLNDLLTEMNFNATHEFAELAAKKHGFIYEKRFRA